MKWILYAIIFVLSFFGFRLFDFATINLFLALILLFAALVIQITIHEFGHLIMGLTTGYTFISFRLFFFLLYKNESRFKILFLPDNAFWGQCLMEPPLKDEKGNFPFFWYSAGGVFFNIATFLIALSFLFSTSGLTQFMIFAICVCGLLLALFNAVPSIDKIPNDGHNIRSIFQNKQAKEAYYIQLYANAKVFQGSGYAELEQAAIALPIDVEIDCPLIVTAKFIEYYHSCYNLDFERAHVLIIQLDFARNILEYHRDLILLEKIFTLLMLGYNLQAKEQLEQLNPALRQAFLKSSEIDKKRILLAINALLNPNDAAVPPLYQQCLQAAKTYHLRGVAKDEIGLVNYIYQRFKENKNE